MSSSNFCFLTHIQVSQETGKMVRYSHRFKNFPQFVVIYIVKGFSVVSESNLKCILLRKRNWFENSTYCIILRIWYYQLGKTMDHGKSKRVPEKHLFLLYWLCQNLCVDHNKLWKILKEMGTPDHLTFLLRNLYAGHEATVGTGHGTTDWFQIGKGVCQGWILSPWLFNLYA